MRFGTGKGALLRRLFWLVFFLTAAIAAARVPEGGVLRRQVYSEPHMGTLVRITLFAEDEEIGESAAKAAFRRIRYLDSILSDYDPDSELMQLTRHPPGTAVRISDDLYEVLRRSLALSKESEGSFDVTIGPLVRLWREARREGTLPAEPAITEARKKAGHWNLRLDNAGKTATLLVPGMQLDLGGIAKGYAADEALAVLRAHGVLRAMVAAAGDIAAGDPPPGQNGWRVGIASIDTGRTGLTTTVFLNNRAVSTSGDTEQFIEIDGVRYSHIVDPVTGLGLTERVGATVLAPDATTADSLSTLISVWGPERGLALVEARPGVEALIFISTAAGIKSMASSGFPRD